MHKGGLQAVCLSVVIHITERVYCSLSASPSVLPRFPFLSYAGLVWSTPTLLFIPIVLAPYFTLFLLTHIFLLLVFTYSYLSSLTFYLFIYSLFSLSSLLIFPCLYLLFTYYLLFFILFLSLLIFTRLYLL